MKKWIVFLTVLLSLILVLVGCAQQSSFGLKMDKTYSNTEIFIYLNDQGYSLVKPELLWSGPAAPTSIEISPDGGIYLGCRHSFRSAPPKNSLYRIEKGKLVHIRDYNENYGDFGFSSNGTLYFVDGSGGSNTILKEVSGGREIYYQTKWPLESAYIRDFTFSPDDTLYFTDWTGIYKVENGVESLLYDFKTRSRELNLGDEMWSIAITRDGTVYFTSDVFFRHGEGGWRGFGPAGMVLQLTKAGKEQVIYAAINQEARGIAVGPDNSLYILTWIGKRSGNNEMRLWKLTSGQEILQTNTNTLQAHSEVGATVYTVTNKGVSNFQGENNGLSFFIANNPGSTSEVIIAIPKGTVKNLSKMSAKVGDKEIVGRIIESETMYFVVVSYSQIQGLEKLSLKWG